MAHFLLEIVFDESIITLDTVEYGAFLGDPTDLFETDVITTIGTGTVEIDAFSFLADFELDALQPGSFTLATLTFSGLMPGISSLEFGFVDVSDATGFSLVATTLTASEIVVVPLPGALLLMISGMLSGLSLFGFLKYKRR